MTSFSVVIPTYNRRDYLLECLESVAAQRLAPHEVIVVDDGSTDGTVEAVEGMAGVTLIRQANAGPGAARNRGAAAATGEYLAFLDSDDLWFPWSLEAMAALIERHRPSLLFARFEDFDGNMPPVAVRQPPEGAAFEDFLASTGHDCFAGAGMMVVERTRFLAAGGFIEDRLNAEDHDLALRLGTAPGFVQVKAPLIGAHRMHLGNEGSQELANERGIARLVEAEKQNLYPGGASRRRERTMFVAARSRPVAIAALKSKQLSRGVKFWLTTFRFNLQMLRARYFLYSIYIIVRRALFGSFEAPENRWGADPCRRPPSPSSSPRSGGRGGWRRRSSGWACACRDRPR